MQKPEIIYRELLYQRLEEKRDKFTQLELGKKLELSLSVVNKAIKPLESVGAIIKMPMGFGVIDPKKILYLWASKRRLERDIVYQTRVERPISEVERSLPNGTIYSAYSAYKFKFEDVPADYSEVIVYADEEQLKEIKKRFPEKKGPANLFILGADEHLSQTTKNGICSIGNMFVDFWNLKSWYAKEFLQSLEKRVEEMI